MSYGVRTRCVLLATAIGLAGCGRAQQPPAGATAEYVGSAACAQCHQDIYDRWKTTLMANVVQDPAAHPGVVVGDFATPDSLVTFDLSQVAFTYGSKWKQRYFTRVGNDYYVFPAQWDVQNKVWRPYRPGPTADWWVPYYPSDPMQRPTGPLCDGCHSVNYDVKTKTVTEWNVGCERCHGPGSLHVQVPLAETIGKADWPGETVRSTDVCIQCHSQGRPLTNPIEGQYYDWPVGYHSGDRLSDSWELEEHKLGEETFTHWPDGSAHKNRMQGNDFVQSEMYKKGVTCSACHDVHGTDNDAELKLPGNAVCLQCHGPQLQPGPKGPLTYHTQHAKDSEGSQCIACHMPLIDRTVANVNVRSHTFRFITPDMTDQYGIPNPCNSCHTDKSTQWARDQLKTWPSVSPWRVGS
jgi:predicted CXXCH cytochrome family protein